ADHLTPQSYNKGNWICHSRVALEFARWRRRGIPSRGGKISPTRGHDLLYRGEA
ncbi:hypothetical protein AVEN_126339-1, partial [Araneus ventricosus]